MQVFQMTNCILCQSQNSDLCQYHVVDWSKLPDFARFLNVLRKAHYNTQRWRNNLRNVMSFVAFATLSDFFSNTKIWTSLFWHRPCYFGPLKVKDYGHRTSPPATEKKLGLLPIMAPLSKALSHKSNKIRWYIKF